MSEKQMSELQPVPFGERLAGSQAFTDLFRDGTPPSTLRVESGRMTSKGTAIASFVPELGVAVGTSPPVEANASEEKRQKAIAEGAW